MDYQTQFLRKKIRFILSNRCTVRLNFRDDEFQKPRKFLHRSQKLQNHFPRKFFRRTNTENFRVEFLSVFIVGDQVRAENLL